MDELEKRLKRDADDIRAEPSPELQLRIDASLRAAREIGRVETREAPRPHRFWLISSLTGLTAAALVIVLLNWRASNPDAVDGGVARIDEMQTEPGLPADWEAPRFPLAIDNADLTEPLEQELEDLQTDLEKAAASIERDVRNTF